MAQPAASPVVASRQSGFADASSKNEASVSGVSWPAVIGGAFVAAAISLILLALGAGMGLSSLPGRAAYYALWLHNPVSNSVMDQFHERVESQFQLNPRSVGLDRFFTYR
jgi:hypothetical protein